MSLLDNIKKTIEFLQSIEAKPNDVDAKLQYAVLMIKHFGTPEEIIILDKILKNCEKRRANQPNKHRKP